MQVLILDNDETSKNLLVSLLTKQGHRVQFSATGKDGLQKINDLPPDIILYDTKIDDVGVPGLMQQLSYKRETATIPIVAMSSHTDADEMERFLAYGCVDYFTKSGFNLISLVEALPKLVASAGSKSISKVKGGLLSVFLSAKGGAGTSSLCANIGTCLAKTLMPSTVSVADLVLPMGSIASIIGYKDAFDIIDVANLSRENITAEYLKKNLIVKPNWHFYFLPGVADPDRALKLNAQIIPDITNALCATFDYTLIDFGRALSKISLPTILKADVVVVVLGTEKSSVNLTKVLCQYLQSQGIEARRLFLILNRSVGLEGVSKAEAEQIIGLPIRLTIPYMDSNFTLANNQNMPVQVKFPTATATMILNQAALDISSLAIKVNQPNS
jgi:MinD-like ATPase involved in chromosome partitioning or flagellar assembly/CheY-like chemotaxis protein